MESEFVDFRVIKASVSIEALVAHYGLKLKRSGNNHVGRCPIHKGEGERAFSVSFRKGGFKCHSCNAAGNVLDLVAAIEGCTVREAALKLKKWFNVPMSDGGGATAVPAPRPNVEAPTTPAPETGEQGSNKPLTFQLSGIDPTHPYLAERGITAETAAIFGLGYFPGKGSMSGRVVIPIHNSAGELVAYAGRAMEGGEPKYKLPPGFHKAAELYNLHRALARDRGGRVVVVEGFFDCLKIYQAVQGNEAVVALMGCSLSEQQEKLLAENFYEVVLLLDGDDAGRSGAANAAARLARRCWVRVLELVDGSQPDSLSGGELRQLLNAI